MDEKARANPMMKSHRRKNIQRLILMIVLALAAVAAYMLVDVRFDKPKLVRYAMKGSIPKFV